MAENNSQPEFVAASAWKLFVPTRDPKRRHPDSAGNRAKPFNPEVDYDATAALQGALF